MQGRSLLVPAAALLLGACLDQPTAPDDRSPAGGGPTAAVLAVAIGSQPLDLGTLGGASARAEDINASGQIVGTSSTKSPGDVRAFLWQGGVMKDLGTLYSGWSEGYGIDDAGEVVGAIPTPRGIHAFLWRNGAMRDLGTSYSSDDESIAYDVNDGGVIAGYSASNDVTSDGRHPVLWISGQITNIAWAAGTTSGLNAKGHAVGGVASVYLGPQHAFLYADGKMTALGGDNSYAFAINVHDQAVGTSLTSAGAHAVLWENGRMRDLGTLPGESKSGARAINDNGQVVGVSGKSAFVWYNGVMNSLRPLGEYTSAEAINTSGQVAGTSGYRAVRWTLPPVNFWTARKAIPSARRDAAVAVVNGIVHVIGGVNQAGVALKAVGQYDPGANSWTTGVPLPAARHSGNGARVIGNWLYLPGGFDADGNLTRTLYAYNLTSRTWTTRANLPVPSGCGGSAVIDGKLYVFTGCTGPRGETRVGLLHRFDPVTNAWAALSAAPSAHRQPAVATLEGKLYVAGGIDAAGNVTARLDVYTPGANSWSTKASMPTARRGAAGVAMGGRFHVIGGISSGSSLKIVEAYSPITDFWVTRAPVPTARFGLGLGLIDGLAYAVGGRDGTTVVVANERYTP
ncbi:MAG TPA: kelch repeat-containing protein [Gemmatimonadales bacterium]|nr:kelch repeat-containing protein [Gemmatimonadales bacterium]